MERSSCSAIAEHPCCEERFLETLQISSMLVHFLFLHTNQNTPNLSKNWPHVTFGSSSSSALLGVRPRPRLWPGLGGVGPFRAQHRCFFVCFFHYVCPLLCIVSHVNLMTGWQCFNGCFDVYVSMAWCAVVVGMVRYAGIRVV